MPRAGEKVVPGALPENVGHDPADTNRVMGTTQGRDRDVIAYLNRMIMFQQQNLSIVEALRDATPDTATRDRFATMVDENRRALEVLERAIRDLHGTVNPVRRTSGMLIAKARGLIEDLPGRARRAIESRDIEQIRGAHAFQRVVDYSDAIASAQAVAAHWDVLKEIGDAADLRGVKDAVNEARDSQHAHVDYLKERMPTVVRTSLNEAVAERRS